MRINSTKARLAAGETVFGCFVRFPDAALVEFLGYQNLDFIVIDAEHGTLEPRDCEHMVRALELRQVTPIIRVTNNSAPVILRYMDTGAQGLHVPCISSADEAEKAVCAVKYHPRGARGLGSVRAADYGQSISLREYVVQANAATMAVMQIETAEAVDQLPELTKVDGIDVLFIGPTDLSQSYGVPGQPEHPIVQKAIQKIVDAARHANISLGVMVPSAEEARKWHARGAKYIATTLEAILGPAVREYVLAARR